MPEVPPLILFGTAFGFSSLVLWLAYRFFITHYWPSIQKREEREQQERIEERKEWQEERKATTVTLQQISINLVAIASSIQKINEGQGLSTQAIQSLAKSIQRTEKKPPKQEGS